MPHYDPPRTAHAATNAIYNHRHVYADARRLRDAGITLLDVIRVVHTTDSDTRRLLDAIRADVQHTPAAWWGQQFAPEPRRFA